MYQQLKASCTSSLRSHALVAEGLIHQQRQALIYQLRLSSTPRHSSRTKSCISARSLPRDTSAYVSIRQHTSAYVSLRPHTLQEDGAAFIIFLMKRYYLVRVICRELMFIRKWPHTSLRPHTLAAEGLIHQQLKASYLSRTNFHQNNSFAYKKIMLSRYITNGRENNHQARAGRPWNLRYLRYSDTVFLAPVGYTSTPVAAQPE